MKLLGINYRNKNVPPKIWRAIMLDRYGLPTTDYLIIDLYKVSREQAEHYFLDALATSKYGIVVKTVTWEDGKNQPYCWVGRNDLRIVPGLIDRNRRQYLMAFAPLTSPRDATGFTVGRYAILCDETHILEYVRNEIQPRVLEYLTSETMKNGRYGILFKNPGRLFRASPSGSMAADILNALKPYQNAISLLISALRTETSYYHSGGEVCLEFVLNNATEAIEFHDFDL